MRRARNAFDRFRIAAAPTTGSTAPRGGPYVITPIGYVLTTEGGRVLYLPPPPDEQVP